MLEAVVELGQLDLHVVLDVLLLVADDLEDFVFELLLSLDLQLLELVEHGVHEGGQNAHVLGRHLLSLLDVVLDVAEVLFEVVQPLQGTSNLLLFALELVQRSVAQTKHFGVGHCLLGVRHLRLLVRELLLDALLAKRLLLEHHDGLREVLLAEVHLHCVRKERHLLTTSSFRFFQRACHCIRVAWHVIICRGVGRLACGLLSLIDHFLVPRRRRVALGSQCREVCRIHLLVAALSLSRHWHLVSLIGVGLVSFATTGCITTFGSLVIRVLTVCFLASFRAALLGVHLRVGGTTRTAVQGHTGLL